MLTSVCSLYMPLNRKIWLIFRFACLHLIFYIMKIKKKKAFIKKAGFENTITDQGMAQRAALSYFHERHYIIVREMFLWARQIPFKNLMTQMDRDLFPESPVFNTANSSTVKHPSQSFPNYSTNSLPKTLWGCHVVLVFSQDRVSFFSGTLVG